MSEKTIWWDRFEDEPTLTRETAAPPERYTEVLINSDCSYLEVWKADATGGQKWNHTNIHVSFSVEEWSRAKDHHKNTWEHRDRIAKEKEVKLVRMLRWYVPPEHYERIARRAQWRANYD